MYLDKNHRNRLTIGKTLRALKALRKKDATATPLPPSPTLQAYK